MGRSQKCLFVFTQTLYGLLLPSHVLQNVSFLGLWVLLVLEGILWFEALDLWCVPGKLTRRKGRLSGQHDVCLVSHTKKLPFATCFLWVLHLIIQAEYAPLSLKRWFSHI